MTYRILVTGSRTWSRSDSVAAALLDVALPAIAAGRRVAVVHGAASAGADYHARQWARRGGVRLVDEPHPADWTKYRGAAGFRRNAEMVALGADICLAFLRRCESSTCQRADVHDSHGTTHCADLAERSGIPVTRLRWDER